MREPCRTERLERPDGCSIEMRVYNSAARRCVVLSNGLGCGEVLWRHLIDDLGSDHRVVTWDVRGQGASAEADGPGAYTASAHAADLAAVQEAAGAERAAHVGFGFGATVALEHHSWNPDTVEALVIIQGGLCRGPLPWGAALARQALTAAVPLAPFGASILKSRQGARAIRLAHSLATRTNVVGRTCDLGDFETFLDVLAEQSTAGQLRLFRGIGSHRSVDVLARVRVPTLVFGAARDPICPEALMLQVHEALHNSEYVRLPGATHACLLERGPVISARIRRFLDERRQQTPWKEHPILP